MGSTNRSERKRIGLVEDWRLFFEMGGYGVYVWSSYGLSLLVLALLWLAVHRRKVRALQRLVQRDT